MKHVFRIFFFCAISVFDLAVLHAQESKNYYAGISTNISGYHNIFSEKIDAGFGIEIGLRNDFFYAGFEYGVYGLTMYGVPYDIFPHSYDIMSELGQYFGLHGGYIIDNWLWLGIVFLLNPVTITHYTVDSTNYTSYQNSKILFNIGPDVRFSLSRKMTLNFAYTNQRGLKIGAGYVF